MKSMFQMQIDKYFKEKKIISINSPSLLVYGKWDFLFSVIHRRTVTNKSKAGVAMRDVGELG